MSELISVGSSRIDLVEDGGREVTVINTYNQQMNKSGLAYRGISGEGAIVHIMIELLSKKYTSWLSEQVPKDMAIYKLIGEALIISGIRDSGATKGIALLDLQEDSDLNDLVKSFGIQAKSLSVATEDYKLYGQGAFDIVVINGMNGNEKGQLLAANYLVKSNGHIIWMSKGVMTGKILEIFLNDSGNTNETYHISDNLAVHHIDPKTVREDILGNKSIGETVEKLIRDLDTEHKEDMTDDEYYNFICKVNEIINMAARENDYSVKQYMIDLKEALQNCLLYRKRDNGKVYMSALTALIEERR